MIQLRDNYLAVEVPDKIGNPHFYRVNNKSIMLKWDDIERPLNIHDLVKVDTYYGNLDDYKWPQIVCTSKEASVAHAANIVEEVEDGYKGYNTREDNVLFWREPIDSFYSLLTSKGCDLNKNYLILKKQ